MNKHQILKELNIQLQIIRVNRGLFGDWDARIKANGRIDVLTDKLEKSNR